jgi:hypothetical protein
MLFLLMRISPACDSIPGRAPAPVASHRGRSTHRAGRTETRRGCWNGITGDASAMTDNPATAQPQPPQREQQQFSPGQDDRDEPASRSWRRELQGQRQARR